MPRPKKPAPPANTPELNIPKELLDQLVSGPMTQGDLETMFRSLNKAVIERAMSAEMTEHLGYGPGQAKPDGQRNHRNGASPKTAWRITHRSASRLICTVLPISANGTE